MVCLWFLADVDTGTRDQIANICWIIKKAREFQKNIYFCFIDYAKAFDCVQFNSVQSLSRIRLCSPMDCRTPGRPVHQQLLGLLKLMSIESAIPSNHLILCHPVSSPLLSFPASGSFPMSQLFASGGQSIRVSASASALPMNIQD